MDLLEQNGTKKNGGEGNDSETQLHLPPPPKSVPSDVIPERIPEPVVKKAILTPTARRNIGGKGSRIPLLTNHFNVNVKDVSGHFFQYSVSLFYEDGRPVDAKGVGRKVIDRVHTTYESELGGKDLAYDGEKTLFTLGALPSNKLEFTVILDQMSSNRNNLNSSPKDGDNDTDRKRMRRPYQSKTFKVEISYATKIAMQAIAQALRGQENENTQEALRVLDIILRQHASKQGCLLVRQSFFHNDPKNFADVGGGVLGVRGFHSSFRTTQGGLSLNVDVSTTMIVRPGPVVDFLIANQNAKDPYSLDWSKAKRTLKNLRVTASPTNTEFKIVGLSDKICREQLFSLKQRGGAMNGEDNTVEITVYDYFLNYRQIPLTYSADLPCLNVGRPKRPTYIPIELCSLVSLQRYTKALNVLQRSSLVEKSRQKPQERMRALTDALKTSNYDSEPMLRSCGISIGSQFTSIEGRVLQSPRLKCGNGEDFCPRNGRWNFNNKKLLEPTRIERWAVVNFSARCMMQKLIQDLIKCGQMKGISVEPDPFVFEESQEFRRAPPVARVDKMCEIMQSRLPGPPKFLLCLLPERKNSDLYGPWKRRCLTDFGVPTQCLAPMKVNDQYLTNVLLKINAKLGGLNSVLGPEFSHSIPGVSKVPTIIIGMDVSHGSPGHGELPSIAAVVSSRHWPLITRYRASVRTQSPKVEMIDSLFKKVSEKEDVGVIREGMKEFYITSGKRKPDQIIIFRDGVSESQFHQVLNIELDQIMEACKFLDEHWHPKFVVIVAQKNHHTKFFQATCADNVPAGTVIDNKICHPRNNDFYMCAHAGMIGTTRPTHYHVLLDQVGFSADELQDLVHSLSYVYQRSTTAISVVAPICYAHLAASQVGQFVKFEETSETSSSHGGTSAGPVAVPQLPKLDDKVSNSMFFC